MTRYTIPAAVALAVTLHLAGCDKAAAPESAETAPPAAMLSAMTTPLPLASISLAANPAGAGPASTAADTLPGPADRDPAHAVAYWHSAIERRDWTAARSVFGEFGARSGMNPQEFAAAWDKYRSLEVTVGTGRQEGAAGSSSYEVAVTITGVTQAGEPYRLAGRLTLRRVNDVDGASAEQLRWHIERSTLRP